MEYRMPTPTIAAEPIIRLSGFLVVLVVMVLWEVLAPRRQPLITRRVRWPNNLGLVAVNTALTRLALRSPPSGWQS